MAKTPTSKTSSVGSQMATKTPKRKGSSGATRKSVASVSLGLHGFGEVLRTIHAAPNSLQQKFEQEMSNTNLTVVVDAETAKKLKDFVIMHLPEHPLVTRFNRDNCDPATDPWCINI
jgi:hypothetical protein